MKLGSSPKLGELVRQVLTCAAETEQLKVGCGEFSVRLANEDQVLRGNSQV
jgi:hypothetical protein